MAKYATMEAINAKYATMEAINASLVQDSKAAAELAAQSPSPDQAPAMGPSEEVLRVAQKIVSKEKDELVAQMARDKLELVQTYEHTAKLEGANTQRAEKTQLATMRLAAETHNLEEQNKKLTQDKEMAERDFAEVKRLAELRAQQEHLLPRKELPTKIEEEKLRKAHRQEQEAFAAEQKRLEDERAEVKRQALEQEQQLLEEERRNLLTELERDKQEALAKAAAAEVERAKMKEEHEKMVAELDAERQRAALEVARMQEISEVLQRKLAEASMNDAEREEAEVKRRQAEEEKRAEEHKKMQEEIDTQKQLFEKQLEEETHRLSTAAEQERAKLEAEKGQLAAAAELDKTRFEEEKARIATANDEEKALLAAAAEDVAPANEKKKVHFLQFAAATEEDSLRLEEDRAQLTSTTGEERATFEASLEETTLKLAGAGEDAKAKRAQELEADQQKHDEEEDLARAKGALPTEGSTVALTDEASVGSNVDASVESNVEATTDGIAVEQMPSATDQADLNAVGSVSGQKTIEIELVLDMDMFEIEGIDDEFRAQLCQELCEAVKARSDKMVVLELQAGSIITRIALQPGVAQTGMTTDDLVEELRLQLADPESALRQGKYGSRAASLKVLSEQEIQRRNQLLAETEEGQHWKDLADAAADEPLIHTFIHEPADDGVSIAPQCDNVFEKNSVDNANGVEDVQILTICVEESGADGDVEKNHEEEEAEAKQDSLDITDGASHLHLMHGFASLVVVVEHQHEHDIHDERATELLQNSQAVKRCRGTLLTISADWTEAWEGTKVESESEAGVEQAEDEWLGGTMTESWQESDGEHSPGTKHLVPSNQESKPKDTVYIPIKKVPNFGIPRKLEAWGERDVMPMHKTKLAVRKEVSKEQTLLSFEEPSDDEFTEKPDWYARIPARMDPQKSPAFPPAEPLPPIRRNPYTIPDPALNPPISPLTRKRSGMNSHGSASSMALPANDPAVDSHEVLSAQSQMQLGVLLGEMLRGELGDDFTLGQDSQDSLNGVSPSQMASNPPANVALMSELRRWRTPKRSMPEEIIPEPAHAGSSSFPRTDRDAAGADHSNRLSWVPHLYVRSSLLSNQKSRAFLDAFEDNVNDEVHMAPPRDIMLPAIAPALKISFKVGQTMKKKWDGYAAMSEHERASQFRKQAALSTKKTLDKTH